MIEVSELRFAYPQASGDCLKGLDFSLGAGQIFGLLGPSGSGKSTCQKILIGLLQGYRGSARLWGRELRDFQGREMYYRLGVGFELPNHYLKLSAWENLHFFGQFYGSACLAAIPELLERLGLAEAAHKPVSAFSKGMKMRLNLVRALMHQPEILFLDEPTSGLDPNNARLVKDLILDYRRRGCAIVLTTHQMQDAEELCDELAFLVKGQIVAKDSPQALRQRYQRPELKVRFKGEAEDRLYPLADLGQNAEFLHKLQNLGVERIHSQEAGLDQIFIQLTGQSLHQNSPLL